MKKFFTLILFAFGVFVIYGCSKVPAQQYVKMQLNWLHDPTFAGEYFLAKRTKVKVNLLEGGPNVYAVNEVSAGRATVAIIGADIFLQTIDKEINAKKTSDLVCFFVDFQRNPVGWVLHPDAASKAGFVKDLIDSPKKMNEWLFLKIKDGTIKVGDKRGTETTSIWMQWKKMYGLSESVTVLPVGYDTSIVLSAPMLAYPVYLNEEPFKLSEKIGRDVLIFDPAVDGICVYGNVLITQKEFAEKNPEIISQLQSELSESWKDVKNNPTKAVSEVLLFYKGIKDSVVRQQIDKTVEFVFFDNALPGSMDILDNGRWEKTLTSLQEGGLISSKLTFNELKKYLIKY